MKRESVNKKVLCTPEPISLLCSHFVSQSHFQIFQQPMNSITATQKTEE